jgi:hypothetical protein
MPCIENHVRTVIAIGINTAPENLRPTTILSGFPNGQMIAIQRVLERDLKIKLKKDAWVTCTTVGDWIDVCERADAQKREAREKAA